MTEGNARTPQFLRYAGAGAVGTAVHYSTLIALVQTGIATPRRRFDAGRDRRRAGQLRAQSPLHVREPPRARACAAALRRRRGRRHRAQRGRARGAAHRAVRALPRRAGRGDAGGARLRLSRQPAMDVLTARPRRRRRRDARAPVGRRARVQRGGGPARVPPAADRGARHDPRRRRGRLRERRQPRSYDRAAARTAPRRSARRRRRPVAQLRQGGRDERRARSRARRRRDRHRRRPAGPAGTDAGDGGGMAGRLRHRADAAPVARRGELVQARHRPRVLPHAPERSRRSRSPRTSATSGCCRAARWTRCARCPSAAGS